MNIIFRMKQGKCILFGEHFIRNDCDAIVLPLQKEITIEIKEEIKNDNNNKTDKKRKKLEIYNEKNEKIKNDNYNQALSEEAIKSIEQKLKIISKDKILLYTVTTNMPINTGLGSSAGFCVGIIRSLQEKYQLTLTKKQIFTLAKETENLFHKNTSGIDIIITMLQKPMIVSNKKEQLKIKTIESNKINNNNEDNNDDNEFQFILINAGTKIATKEIIMQVIEYEKKNKEKFNKLKINYQKIIKRGIEIINNQDNKKNNEDENNNENNKIIKIKELGQLMNQNHLLLKELGLSNQKIEEIREFAFQNNARGAKITGAGCGGHVLILTAPENRAVLLNKFKEKGYEGFTT